MPKGGLLGSNKVHGPSRPRSPPTALLPNFVPATAVRPSPTGSMHLAPTNDDTFSFRVHAEATILIPVSGQKLPVVQPLSLSFFARSGSRVRAPHCSRTSHLHAASSRQCSPSLPLLLRPKRLPDPSSPLLSDLSSPCSQLSVAQPLSLSPSAPEAAPGSELPTAIGPSISMQPAPGSAAPLSLSPSVLEATPRSELPTALKPSVSMQPAPGSASPLSLSPSAPEAALRFELPTTLGPPVSMQPAPGNAAPLSLSPSAPKQLPGLSSPLLSDLPSPCSQLPASGAQLPFGLLQLLIISRSGAHISSSHGRHQLQPPS